MNKQVSDILSIRPYMTKTYFKHEATTKRIVVHRGGTRSGKTYSLLFNAAQWLLTGKLREGEIIPNGKMAIVRKASTTITRTIQEDFNAIYLFCCAVLEIKPDRHKTDKSYKYRGRKIELIGADDEQKLRGYKCDILYCNEANELTFKKQFFQLLMRCKGPVFLDFNPSDEHVWIKTEIEDKRRHDKGDVDVVVTTYKDNVNTFGKSYLTNEQIEEIENLQFTDPAMWRVYGKGEYGVTRGLVIPSMTIIESLPNGLRAESGGLDFGFTNDPTALYWCGEKQTREERTTDKGVSKMVTFHDLYVDQLIYETGLNEQDLVNKFNDVGVKKSLGVVADSSHPASIDTLRRAGYNVRRAIKKPGSVRTGVNLLRSYRLFVTKRSHGLIKEQTLYKFKELPNGDYSNDPVDANNHAFDGIRYRNTRFSRLKPFK